MGFQGRRSAVLRQSSLLPCRAVCTTHHGLGGVCLHAGRRAGGGQQGLAEAGQSVPPVEAGRRATAAAACVFPRVGRGLPQAQILRPLDLSSQPPNWGATFRL